MFSHRITCGPGPGSLFSFRNGIHVRVAHRELSCITPHGFLDTLWGNDKAVTIDDDAAGQALYLELQAAESNGLSSFSQQPVVCAVIPGQGRGLVATQNIRPGHPLVTLPFQAVITPQRALQLSSLRPLLAASPTLEESALSDWTLMAVWLAELLSLSPGSTYAAVLPQFTGCVLEWSEKEVELLRGSLLYSTAVEIRAAAAAAWAQLSPIVAQAEAAGLLPANAVTSETLSHSFSLLLSRLVRFDDVPGVGTVDAICPWADLVNHDCSCTSFLRYDASSSSVVLLADRTYAPGDQVFASYGQKTSGQLLLSYGFLPEEGSNPHDGCLLTVDLAKFQHSGSELAWKIAALEARGMESTRVFPLRIVAAPEGLLRFAAFAALSVDCAAATERLCEELLGDGRSDAAVELEAHFVGLEAAVGLCKAALAGYHQPLDTNKAELDELRQRGDGSRRAAVLQVLVQEQRVLSRISFILQGQLRELRKRGGGGGNGLGKRR